MLTLNSQAIADVTTGQVINLVSNDVRRFDDAGPFWCWLWGGPLELLLVGVLVGVDLGWQPALALVCLLLLILPVQVIRGGYRLIS